MAMATDLINMEASKFTDIETMESQYYEYRRACYNIIFKHAEERGLMHELSAPKTEDEIERFLGVVPEKKEAFKLFIKALKKYGAITKTPHSQGYIATHSFHIPEFDKNLIAGAIGKDKVDELIHSGSYKGIIDTFSTRKNEVAADFVAGNMQLWDEFLQQPFYAFGRQMAVHAVARKGARVADLACGPGYGLRELFEIVGEEGRSRVSSTAMILSAKPCKELRTTATSDASRRTWTAGFPSSAEITTMAP